MKPEQNQFSGDINKPGDKNMAKAYKLSSALIRDRIQSENAEDLKYIDQSKVDDVIVINGTYDHIHTVLSLTNIPFTQVNPTEMNSIKLRPDQTVFVNCGSGFPAEVARQLATFVNSGGQLITTDWALKHVLEVAFPEMVKYNGKATADEVVRIEIANKEDPVITGFLDEEADPVWWLEGSSYPIQIMNHDKVEVLIKSKELGEKYDENAVVIKFNHGKGVVYHMISHFYLQRTETRDKKHSSSAKSYAMSKGGSDTTNAMFQEAEADGVDYGVAQSAATSAEFLTRSIIEQKKRAAKNKYKEE